VRALLIVNPRATSTTRLRRDVIARALASAVDLQVVQTSYRGHATALAATARAEGYGLVITLGGDGTANEAVNGILAHPAGQPGGQVPALAALPGGSANVFTGALGMPRDPVDAAGAILQALARGRERTIGLGVAEGRYFTFNSGLGLDAEVVRAVQGLRAHGRPVTPALWVRLTLRQFYRQTDRRRPGITVELAGQPDAGPVFVGIVSNTAPWTYLGRRPVQATPQAGFDTGLDLFALRTLSSAGTLHALGQMLRANGKPPHGRNIMIFHDQPSIVLRADRPVAFQIDGEYAGERESVTFSAVPDALRVVA
jgi:diacylglycerol kinase family enzyme